MPIPLTINGVKYQYPKLGDESWGQDATNWAIGTTQIINSIDTLINNTIVAGLFELADGSAATPSLRFQNNLTTGLYRAGSNTIGFSTNGSSVGTVNASGLWSLNSLSVSGNTSVTTLTLTELNANGYYLDEQLSASLTDNTVGTVLQFPVASTKNIIVDYSITRGTGKETGQIILSTDGTNVQVSGQASTVVDCGVSFSGDINTGNVRLRYTTTSTGTNATMKYLVKRWND